MSYITTTPLILDVKKTNVQVVKAKQYDDSTRFLVIKVVDGNNIINLKGYTVNFKAYSSANRPILDTCTILSDGTAQVELTDNILYDSGKMNAEIQIVDDDGVLSTMPFILQVVSSVYPDDEIIGTPEFSALTLALQKANEKVEDLIQYVDLAKGYSEDSLGYANTAKSYRDEASSYASQASGFVISSRTNATNAANSASAAATSATNAKASENNAANSATKAEEASQYVVEYAEEAEAWAVGQRNGEDVDPTDETYYNNAKYYSGLTKVDAENTKTYSDSAKASADSAKVSETNSKSSEDNAKISETNAKTSEDNAKTSEDNAKISENNAKASEVNAKLSENAAKLSEQNAKSSEDSVSRDAQSALQSATNAAISEANAKTSEDNAKNSETNAATSEVNASDSAASALASKNSAETASQTATTKAGEASGYAERAENAYTSTQEINDIAKSWAVGPNGSTDTYGTDIDNSKYWYNQAKSIAQGLAGALLPMGTIPFALLPAEPDPGWMYNISDEFTTDERFKEGSGHVIPLGAEIYFTADGYWSVMAGSPVAGVKGNAETDYRSGNVNITPANIGLGNVDNTADLDKPVFVGATASDDGVQGYVPAPSAGDEDKALFGDGTFRVVKSTPLFVDTNDFISINYDML